MAEKPAPPPQAEPPAVPPPPYQPDPKLITHIERGRRPDTDSRRRTS